MTQEAPRILCIDDDAAFREAVSQRLKEEGFHVTAVATGREGIVATWTERFDILLLDMDLPDATGLQTYQDLRANPATSKIPVILLTEYAKEERWEALPYETEAPCFLMGRPACAPPLGGAGRPTDAILLMARINQVLSGVGSGSGRTL